MTFYAVSIINLLTDPVIFLLTTDKMCSRYFAKFVFNRFGYIWKYFNNLPKFKKNIKAD